MQLTERVNIFLLIAWNCDDNDQSSIIRDDFSINILNFIKSSEISID
jgi:hypothetical protein